jgi:hypothetical protein
MLNLLNKYGYINNNYKVLSIKSIYIPYFTIKSYIMYEECNIDFNKYKIDQIKKLLSSDHEDILSLIEEIIFK